MLRNQSKVGGRGRDRTGDPLLAKQVLSQLSYTPTALFILRHAARLVKKTGSHVVPGRHAASAKISHSRWLFPLEPGFSIRRIRPHRSKQAAK